jgi:hypothetical protein
MRPNEAIEDFDDEARDVAYELLDEASEDSIGLWEAPMTARKLFSEQNPDQHQAFARQAVRDLLDKQLIAFYWRSDAAPSEAIGLRFASGGPDPTSFRLLELDDVERATVDRFNRRFAGRQHRVTAGTLFNDWVSLVKEVESGYADSVDDYTNDLTSRDLLEDLIRDSQPSLRAKLETALKPWDERFRRATTHDDGKALSRFFSIKDRWWWRRTPRTGQLATYLRQRVPSADRDERIGSDHRD